MAQLTLTPVADLLNSPDDPVEFLIQELLPRRALVLLAADPKVGKSTLATSWARSLLHGQPWAGLSVEKTSILWLAVEEGRPALRARLQAHGIGPSDELTFHIGHLDDVERTFRELQAFVKQHSVGLVVLDTFATFASRLEDENDNAMMVRAVLPWLDLTRLTGCTVLLVHHTRKGGGRYGQDIRGASSLLAMVDQAITVKRPRGRYATASNRRRLDTVGRFSGVLETFEYELEGGECRPFRPPAQPANPGQF